MAFKDTLFQLGMDLTRSSTTQKEEFGTSVSVDRELRKENSEDTSGIKFAGTHLSIDLFGARRLDNVTFVEMALRRCIAADGAHALHIHLSKPEPGQGVTGMILIGDVHVSIRSSLSDGYAALDVFSHGTLLPSGLPEALRVAFSADHVASRVHDRAKVAPETLTWKTAKKPARLPKAVKARVAAA
ncbi:MAG: S-adenosylmethionine decarboxylase [Hyphomicrobiaceae bacterium]|nr:adenosylmethionine decarboxylase [Hyphomicrobiaceae bacterium]